MSIGQVIHGEQSYKRNLGGGILVEECLRRILKEKSWRRSPGGGIMEEESYSRSPGEEFSSGNPEGGTLEESWKDNPKREIHGDLC